MNRPKLEYNKIKANLDGKQMKVKIDLSKFGYLSDLERYCDSLERALDKACEYLAFYSLGADEDCWNFNWDEDQWKELLLKDE